MADRVNYFLLGLLFLIVAGVIAYDRWNPGGESPEDQLANQDNRATVTVEPVQPAPSTGTAIKIDTATNGGSSAAPGRRPGGRSLDLGTQPFAPDPDQRTEVHVSPSRPRTETRPPVQPTEVRPTPTETERFHIVQPGESLATIAIHYYGTSRGMSAIVAANRISDPNRIYAKQRLVIPAFKESVRRAPSTSRPAPSRSTPTTIPAKYTVKRNDGDLYKICTRFYGSKGLGARVDQVMELNGLWSATVEVGSTIQLPRR